MLALLRFTQAQCEKYGIMWPFLSAKIARGDIVTSLRMGWDTEGEHLVQPDVRDQMQRNTALGKAASKFAGFFSSSHGEIEDRGGQCSPQVAGANYNCDAYAWKAGDVAAVECAKAALCSAANLRSGEAVTGEVIEKVAKVAPLESLQGVDPARQFGTIIHELQEMGMRPGEDLFALNYDYR